MSVEVVRGAYEAFDRGDLDGVVACFADEIVWEQAQGLPHGGVYRGRDAVRTHIFDPLDAEWWVGFRADAHEFIDAGDDVVVLGRYYGRGRESGRTLDVPFAHVWTLRDGRAVRFRQFLDTAGWNSALGQRHGA